MNTHVVSITKTGQMTLPAAFIRHLGLSKPGKVQVTLQEGAVSVTPIPDFWSTAGSLKSDVRLTDEQLQAARWKFEEEGFEWNEADYS